MTQLFADRITDDIYRLLRITGSRNSTTEYRYLSTNSFSADSKIGIGNYSYNSREFRQNPINTSTITRGIYADLSGIVREYHIVIPNPRVVVEYLQKNDDLVDVLWKVAKIVSGSFQSPNEISLEVRFGDDSSDEILVVFVRMNEYPSDIFDKLDSICDEFESDLIPSEGFILLTTDFQAPKYSNGIPVV